MIRSLPSACPLQRPRGGLPSWSAEKGRDLCDLGGFVLTLSGNFLSFDVPPILPWQLSLFWLIYVLLQSQVH